MPKGDRYVPNLEPFALARKVIADESWQPVREVAVILAEALLGHETHPEVKAALIDGTGSASDG